MRRPPCICRILSLSNKSGQLFFLGGQLPGHAQIVCDWPTGMTCFAQGRGYHTDCHSWDTSFSCFPLWPLLSISFPTIGWQNSWGARDSLSVVAACQGEPWGCSQLMDTIYQHSTLFVLIFGEKWDKMRHKQTLFPEGRFYFFNHL